jgi:hypothetical protein
LYDFLNSILKFVFNYFQQFLCTHARIYKTIVYLFHRFIGLNPKYLYRISIVPEYFNTLFLKAYKSFKFHVNSNLNYYNHLRLIIHLSINLYVLKFIFPLYLKLTLIVFLTGQNRVSLYSGVNIRFFPSTHAAITAALTQSPGRLRRTREWR